MFGTRYKLYMFWTHSYFYMFWSRYYVFVFWYCFEYVLVLFWWFSECDSVFMFLGMVWDGIKCWSNVFECCSGVFVCLFNVLAECCVWWLLMYFRAHTTSTDQPVYTTLGGGVHRRGALGYGQSEVRQSIVSLEKTDCLPFPPPPPVLSCQKTSFM